MKLIDIKDTLPVGFIPIQETIDTRKLASVLQFCALGAATAVRWWRAVSQAEGRSQHCCSLGLHVHVWGQFWTAMKQSSVFQYSSGFLILLPDCHQLAC